jgi:HEAT repeat protein
MIENRCPILLVCIAILFAGCSRKQEVVYQGKPLSEWIEMLEGTNPTAKLSAVNAVGKIGPEAKEAIPALIEMIRQTRNHDRKTLLGCNHALLAMGKEIVPYMISLLKDDEWEMRRGAAWILGKVGPDAKAAVPALTEALKDPNPAVQKKAAEALQKITGKNAEAVNPHSGESASKP